MPLTRSVSPRRLAWILLLVAIAGAVGLLVLWLGTPGSTSGDSDVEGVTFVDFAAESTATVGFAGEFPQAGGVGRLLGMVGATNRILLADGDAGAILAFNLRGALEASAAVEPSSAVPVSYPVDVAVLEDGRIAVVDSSSMRVVVIPAPGQDGDQEEFVGAGQARPAQPTAIEAAAGAVYVADAASHSIKVYDEDGSFMREIGSDLDPPLTFVGGLHLADAGLYVSDSNAGRVLLLDPVSGEARSTVQRRFGLPRGIATDGEGRLFVADAFESAVYVFDPTGRVVEDLIGGRSTERIEEGGALASPEAVLWDPDTRRLYVSDSTQGVVKVYNVRTEVSGE